MRILILLLLSCSSCLAQSRLYEINDQNVVVGWGFRNAPQPGNTLITVPETNITKNTVDDSGLTNSIYRYVGGFIVLRTAADLTQERAVVARRAALEALFEAQVRVARVEPLRLRFPNSASIAAELAAANARFLSVAQSIGITTATTQ